MKKPLPHSLLLFALFACSPYQRLEKPEYSLKEPSTDEMALASEAYENWNFYGGKKLSQIDWNSPLPKPFTGTLPTAVVGISPNLQDSLVFGQRYYSWEKTLNFRDLGGIRSANGQQLRWGMLFRSGHLHELKTKEWPQLEDMGIKTVIDLRTIGEKNHKPDHLPHSIRQIHIPISGITDEDLERTEKEIRKQSPEEFDGEGKMQTVMERFARDGVADFRKIFEILLDENNYPLVFHCTAGKDRTGLLSAFILHALGVDSEVVLNDYLLSNYYRYEKTERNARLGARILGIDTDSSRPIMEVRSSYLAASMNFIQKEYGSLEVYLHEELAIEEAEVEQLKKILLR